MGTPIQKRQRAPERDSGSPSSWQRLKEKLVIQFESVLEGLLPVFKHSGIHIKWLLILGADAAAYWAFPSKTPFDDFLGFSLKDGFFGFLILACLIGWGIEILFSIFRK